MDGWMTNLSPAASTIVFIVAFALMEAAAALLHRFVMHGLLWIWHEDHHVPKGHALQRNDLFALMFAIPSWLLIMTGMQAGAGDWRTPMGFGILAYGVVYSVVHDTVIHRRFPWRIRASHWYLQALREAHAVHHQSQARLGGVNFGMLWVPWKYFNKHRTAAAGNAVASD